MPITRITSGLASNAIATAQESAPGSDSRLSIFGFHASFDSVTASGLAQLSTVDLAGNTMLRGSYLVSGAAPGPVMFPEPIDPGLNVGFKVTLAAGGAGVTGYVVLFSDIV